MVSIIKFYLSIVGKFLEFEGNVNHNRVTTSFSATDVFGAAIMYNEFVIMVNAERYFLKDTKPSL